MRGRLLVAGFGVFASLSPALAQFPPPAPLPTSSSLPPVRGPAPYRPPTPFEIPRFPEPPKPVQPTPPATMPAPVRPTAPTFPVQPAGGTVPVQQQPLTPPELLPPGVVRTVPLQPSLPQPGAMPATPPMMPDGVQAHVPAEVPLPQPENKIKIDAGAISLKRVRGSWQVWMGQTVLGDFGNDETGAKDVVRVMRELRPTEWIQIGSPRPVVEYGLTNGRPPITGAFPKMVVPIDFKTVRVEPVRGVWCLRDDGNIHFNFGLNKPDADQTLAVIRKYGFNRIGRVGGNVAMPALTYFFVSLESDGAQPPKTDAFTAAAQEQSLLRTGIPVPGVGYFGVSLKIDPRKVEARREGFEWVVAHGQDIIARFGVAEFTARDAARVIQDGRFTEFCTAGGVTFFLVNGRAPTRVPFSVQGRGFSRDSLKVQRLGDRWAVTENGRHLFDVPNEQEGESLVRLLKHYQFDQICQVGSSPRSGLMFLAKSR